MFAVSPMPWHTAMLMRGRMQMSKWLIGLVVALLAAQASAQSLYRCQEKGRTILSNTPCSEAPPSAVLKGSAPQSANTLSAADARTGDYQTAYGIWRGQVQYQATTRGRHVAEAHAVVPLVLGIETDGKITGVSTENGCKFLGIATPSSYSPRVLQVDITLSNCGFRGYNRRFTGHVTVDEKTQVANLSLNALDAWLAHAYNVKATMRR